MFPAGTSHRERRNLGSFRSHCATVVKEFTQFEVERLRTGRSMKSAEQQNQPGDLLTFLIAGYLNARAL
jgi:hypothetical protein